MYDNVIKNKVLQNLDEKVANISETILLLLEQGYDVNKRKYIRLKFSAILIHAFENIDLLNEQQQRSIERLYNKLSII